MKTREEFDNIRNHKKQYLNLRVKMTLAVQLELILCAVLSYLIDLLLKALWPGIRLNFIWVFLCVSMIVGSILTVVISKYFFSPMKKLRMAMDMVADGDFSVRLEPGSTSTNEIKEIYAGFNLMTRELSSTEMLQSDFVSNVSHEFKTPISAIEGYATLLQDRENLSPEEADRYVEKILFNTQRLSSLVGNILILSRLDAQTTLPASSEFSLDEQIRCAIVLLEPEWSKKDIEFDVEMENVKYSGPEGLMHHIWHNIIGNAIKFSPHGGLVSVRLQTTETSAVFTVDDCGPGISEAAQKHIFDRFYQADTSHRQQGNGLGLALVKKVTEALKGTVTQENLSGGGCRFTVTLPKTL